MVGFPIFARGIVVVAALLVAPGAVLAANPADPAGLVPQAAPKAAAGASGGEVVFIKYCVACHALPHLDQNKTGPSLHNIVGRRAGQAPGFSYSSANLNSKIVWTEAVLDTYLLSPRTTIPSRSVHPGGPMIGTKMTFKGMKDPAERKAVIAFLKAE